MFDPTLPQAGTEIDAVQMRAQLTGLKDLIDAILTITAAQVDTVNTLNPGDPATASLIVDGNTLRFTFGIPRGNDGSQGPQGNDGGTGPQGPPFAGAVVDSVTTVAAGQPATVSVSFDGSNVHFQFGIPQGNDGANGTPGEVSQAQLDNAIQDSSTNSNAVSTLDTPFTNEPATQADVETLRTKINELITALRR